MICVHDPSAPDAPGVTLVPSGTLDTPYVVTDDPTRHHGLPVPPQIVTLTLIAVDVLAPATCAAIRVPAGMNSGNAHVFGGPKVALPAWPALPINRFAIATSSVAAPTSRSRQPRESVADSA